jgi:hypothetical protein
MAKKQPKNTIAIYYEDGTIEIIPSKEITVEKLKNISGKSELINKILIKSSFDVINPSKNFELDNLVTNIKLVEMEVN